VSREIQDGRCKNPRPHSKFISTLLVFLSPAGVISGFAQTTNYVGGPLTQPALSDPGIPSFLRVIGSLVLVIGLFLAGVWFVRNWQRLNLQRGGRPKLNVIETRSLGGRHAIYVVGYDTERFLIASSPSGVNFLSHLPAAVEGGSDTETKNSPAPSFAQALTQVLKGK
jgi:flagellar biogenesis protein FliO